MGRQSGSIVWYNRRRGFGFITHKSGDVWFHRSQASIRTFKPEDRVTFDIAYNSNDQKIALNVVPVETRKSPSRGRSINPQRPYRARPQKRGRVRKTPRSPKSTPPSAPKRFKQRSGRTPSKTPPTPVKIVTLKSLKSLLNQIERMRFHSGRESNQAENLRRTLTNIIKGRETTTTNSVSNQTSSPNSAKKSPSRSRSRKQSPTTKFRKRANRSRSRQKSPSIKSRKRATKKSPNAKARKRNNKKSLASQSRKRSDRRKSPSSTKSPSPRRALAKKEKTTITTPNITSANMTKLRKKMKAVQKKPNQKNVDDFVKMLGNFFTSRL